MSFFSARVFITCWNASCTSASRKTSTSLRSPFSNAIKIISYADLAPDKNSFTKNPLSTFFIRAKASADGLFLSMLSVISVSSPPSMTRKSLFFLDGELSCSGGFSKPSRVPKTFFSLKTKKMAIPAKTRISIIAGLISRSQSMR